jgi:hypothetical protein
MVPTNMACGGYVVKSNPKRNLLGILFLLCILISSASDAQVKFRITPYIGGGIRYALSHNAPDFHIEDGHDSSYYNLHLVSPGQINFHFHGRLMFLDVWNFSVGYLLWTHHYKYSDDLTELWLKIGRTYPHSYYYTMHGITVQYTLNHSFISTRSVKPFIMAGMGKYNGGSKTVEYSETHPGSGLLKMQTSADQEVEGWGYFLGMGVKFLKYAFIALEYSDLGDRNLRASQFLQLSIGVTL